jgi:hypothetical protein
MVGLNTQLTQKPRAFHGRGLTKSPHDDDMTLRRLSSRSSESFTELQSHRWEMKESGKTLQEMQEQIEDLTDPRRDGETCGNVHHD